jgi:hypothetical protein
MMNISPVPIPNNLFQPLANHWLPANEGRVIVSTCEGVDYLSLDGECRLVHALPKKKRGEEYGLLSDLLNQVREPVQWEDLTSSVPPENLVSWCEKYGVILPKELMSDGREGVQVRTAQVEVLTFYLIHQLWLSVSLPPAETRDVLEQEQKERLRLIRLLRRRYFSIDLASPAYPLHVAATQSNPEQQCLLLKAFLQDVLAQRCSDLTPRPSFLHQPPQLVMLAGCPLTEAYWQLTNLMLNPTHSARRYHICPCGRQFYGRPNQKYCPRCDRRTWSSRRHRGTTSVNVAPMSKRGIRRSERRTSQSQGTPEGRG